MLAATNSQEPTALILVVDDDPSRRQSLRVLLESANHEVMAAADGIEAMSLARERPPDLVMLGLNLPDQDRYEMCQQLKANEQTKYTPIILVSMAHHEVTDQVWDLDVGGDDCLTAPFTNQELLTRVRAHLRVKRAEDNLRVRQRELEAVNRQLLALQAVSANIASTLSLDELLHRVTDGIVQGLGYKYAILVLVEPDQQRLVLGASSGMPLPLLEQLESIAGIDLAQLTLALDDADSPAFRALQAGEVFVTQDATQVFHPLLPESTCTTVQELAGMNAMATLPLLSRGRLLGSILVVSTRPIFSPADIDVLQALAYQAAVAIEQAHLYEEVSRRAQEQAALNLIAETAGQSLELREILGTSLERILDVTGQPGGIIYLSDETGERLTPAAHRNIPAHLLHQVAMVQPNEDPVGEVFRTGQAALLNLTTADVRSHPAATGSDLPHSFAAVPLQAKGAVSGVMVVGSPAPHLVTERDLDLFTAIGNQIGLAIENARLYAEAQQRVLELASLNEIAAAVGESLDLDAVLEQILSHMQTLTQADRMAVYLQENNALVFRLRAALGFSQDMITAGQWIPATDPFIEAMAQEITIVTISAHADSQAGPDSPVTTYLHMQGLQSVILVPLRSRGTVIGSIHLLFAAPHEPSVSERQLLDTISHQVSAAVENAQLYEETRRLAITDGLTGLHNYRYFYEVLGQEIERCWHYDSQLTLIMVDVDDFKEYNDAHGHLAGDDLLADLAQLVRSQIRSADTAARYGGEEFAILLPETDKSTARLVAERIRQTVATHVFVTREAQDHAQITVSAGVAAFPDDAVEARELVHAVDMALYVAKRAGKNCVRVA